MDIQAPVPLELDPIDQKEFDDYTTIGVWNEENDENCTTIGAQDEQ